MWVFSATISQLYHGQQKDTQQLQSLQHDFYDLWASANVHAKLHAFCHSILQERKMIWPISALELSNTENFTCMIPHYSLSLPKIFPFHRITPGESGRCTKNWVREWFPACLASNCKWNHSSICQNSRKILGTLGVIHPPTQNQPIPQRRIQTAPVNHHHRLCFKGQGRCFRPWTWSQGSDSV